MILLRYIEMNSATGRALNIVKMRNSDHNKNVHQFDIGAHGLEIGSAMEGVSGVLGWSALRTTGSRRAADGSLHSGARSMGH